MVKGPGKAGALQPDRRAACSNEPVLLVTQEQSHTCTESAACSETPFQSSHPFGVSERENATGSGRALGKTSQQSATSSGEFRRRSPKSSEQMVHTHWFVHGRAVGSAATQLQERIPSQAATEQVLLWDSLWRIWQQNPLLAAESMQSLFRGTRWSPSLSLHWRRSRELALTGAYRMWSYYCSPHEDMRTSTGPCMTPGTSLILTPGIHSR